MSRGLWILALIGHLSLAGSATAARIDWDTAVPRITEHRAAGPGVQPGRRAASNRITALEGHVRSLSMADSRLYVVFLQAPSDLPELAGILQQVGYPPEWRHLRDDTRLTAFLDGPGSYEWLELKANGAFTIVADDARQPGMQFLAVVNGAGEILGTRPLWRAPDDDLLALLGSTASPSD